MAERKIRYLEGLSDKKVHCIARLLQERIYKTPAACLYCKYAVECSKRYREVGELQRDDLLQEIIFRTGVPVQIPIEGPEEPSKALLKSSWVQKYPVLLHELENMSFKEQIFRLQNINPDEIL